MVESGPGLRSGLTADIRACLKMYLITKRRGSSQSKLEPKQRKRLQSIWLQKRHKKLRIRNVQIPEDAGLEDTGLRGCRSYCMHNSMSNVFITFCWHIFIGTYNEDLLENSNFSKQSTNNVVDLRTKGICLTEITARESN